MTVATPDWSPFTLAGPNEHGEAPRSIRGRDGIGDRLRAAAFAEVQARDAFRWAADRFEDADPKLRKAWLALADSEQRHLDWLLERMRELEIPVPGRKVSDHLWHSLVQCPDARTFAHHMAGAEERGRQAGERFHQSLLEIDPITARIFQKIAEEEVGHIALAQKFFPTSH